MLYIFMREEDLSRARRSTRPSWGESMSTDQQMQAPTFRKSVALPSPSKTRGLPSRGRR